MDRNHPRAPTLHGIRRPDHGRTWHRGEVVPGVSGDECQLVELADGRLMLDIRRQSGPHRWRATSADGGRTWSSPRPGEKVTPVCCAIERRTREAPGTDRDQILWTGPKGPERSNLVVRVSNDEGQTLPFERVLATGPAAYSDFSILNDGSVGVLWERGVDKGYQFVTIARFNEEWLEGESKPTVSRPELTSPRGISRGEAAGLRSIRFPTGPPERPSRSHGYSDPSFASPFPRNIGSVGFSPITPRCRVSGRVSPSTRRGWGG